MSSKRGTPTAFSGGQDSEHTEERKETANQLDSIFERISNLRKILKKNINAYGNKSGDGQEDLDQTSGQETIVQESFLTSGQQFSLMAQPLPNHSAYHTSTPAFTLEQHRNSIQEAEERVKQELEEKYQVRIQELEKRSLYLDKSLDLIEEMRAKFEAYESQQQDYNHLLLKYNSLMGNTTFNASVQQNNQTCSLVENGSQAQLN